MTLRDDSKHELVEALLRYPDQTPEELAYSTMQVEIRRLEERVMALEEQLDFLWTPAFSDGESVHPHSIHGVFLNQPGGESATAIETGSGISNSWTNHGISLQNENPEGSENA